MRVVFDAEANGLLDTVDRVWCVCLENIDNGYKSEWTIEDEYSLNQFLEISLNNKDVTEIIGHHILGYDLPLFFNMIGWEPREDIKITDTLVLSRLANPDRPRPSNCKGGPHSLEAWGRRTGTFKIEHEEWDRFSPKMLERCRGDVQTNKLTYNMLLSELEGFSEESIRLEHDMFKIMFDQEQHGIRFDHPKALEYIDDLTRRIEKIDAECIPKLPKTLNVIGRPVTNPFLKTGGYKKAVKAYLEESYPDINHDEVKLIGGPFTKIVFEPFKISSTQKVKEYLLDNGWIPDVWNIDKVTRERKSPKLEGDFRGIEGDLPKKIKERITWSHRRSQIEGWVRNAKIDQRNRTCTTELRDDPEEKQGKGNPRLRNDVEDLTSGQDPDGRVLVHVVPSLHNSTYFLPAGANSCGTNTGRMRHSLVVNIPKANVDRQTGELITDTNLQRDIYGTQMRSLFIPRVGFKLVGHDASGLELRMLAHYLDDEEFIEEILRGDIHTYNQRKAGLPSRDAAKTFIYALIYGAGDAKIGSIVGGTEDDGAAIKAEYFQAVPKLEKFIERVKRASGKGYLIGLDGRRIMMRKDNSGRIQRSKAPNTLLQAAGAVVMKKSCVLLWDSVKEAQIEAYKVLDMHDEGQSEVIDIPEKIELYSQLAVESIVNAGKHFNLRIPLAADVKIGMNLAETH